MCVAADSNILVQMQIERLQSQAGSEGALAEAVFANSYLALDDGGLCLHEACDCVKGPFSEELRDWVVQLENDGKLRRLATRSDANFKRSLKLAGLPNKDWKWANLARHECVQFLLTEDIDFYDPRDKNSSTVTKERRKNDRTGRVLNLLRDDANVKVISIRHVPDELDV